MNGKEGVAGSSPALGLISKHRLSTAAGKYLVNPPVKALHKVGLPFPGTCILETAGRKTGEPRRTPVGKGLDGDTFWIVAEHGERASYVKNMRANPRWSRFATTIPVRTDRSSGRVRVRSANCDMSGNPIAISESPRMSAMRGGVYVPFRSSAGS